MFIGDGLPLGFEGHHTHGISIGASYPPGAYAKFRTAYAQATDQNKEGLLSQLRALRGTKVKVARQKTPFKKAVLDLFAVPASLFTVL